MLMTACRCVESDCCCRAHVESGRGANAETDDGVKSRVAASKTRDVKELEQCMIQVIHTDRVCIWQRQVNWLLLTGSRLARLFDDGHSRPAVTFHLIEAIAILPEAQAPN